MVYKVLWSIQQLLPETSGQAPSMTDVFTSFFNVHYKTLWIDVPFKGRCNDGQVSHLRTQVSQPVFEPARCWLKTPELEFGALNRSTTKADRQK